MHFSIYTHKTNSTQLQGLQAHEQEEQIRCADGAHLPTQSHLKGIHLTMLGKLELTFKSHVATCSNQQNLSCKGHHEIDI